MLICEGLADDPIESLGGRTPLEAAKTPFMDGLAKKGRTGNISYVPHGLEPASDVACLAALGYDPSEYYTGLAPFEAAAAGIKQEDGEVIFRLDLVTVSEDDTLIDSTAGYIPKTEAKPLIGSLAHAAPAGMKVRAGDSYRNFLVVSGPAAAELDELECVPPERLVGQKLSKSRPKGKGDVALNELMDKSRAILENNEINRVRIDLGENPANGIWLWGHGMKPKLPSFEQKYGVKGALISEADFAQGLGRFLGMEHPEGLAAAIEENEFVFVYMRSGEPGRKIWDLKSKIRRIEDFDTVVGIAAKAAERNREYRLFVGTDYAESLSKRQIVRGPAPFLVSGTGITAESRTYSEKAAAQSSVVIENGHEFMQIFLKTGV
jgi:2,3-bisphosphoglycerate-independent phosphoglycerate mutase